jgi:hypothetical protein
VTTHWIGSFAPAPLKVIGPQGTRAFVDRTLAMLEDDICWRMEHHDDLTWRPEVEVTEVSDGVALESGGVRVLCAPTDHRPVHPTVGYRFEHEGAVGVCAGDTVPCEGLDRLVAGAGVFNDWTTKSLDKLVELVPGRYARDEMSSGFLAALDSYEYRTPALEAATPAATSLEAATPAVRSAADPAPRTGQVHAAAPTPMRVDE